MTIAKLRELRKRNNIKQVEIERELIKKGFSKGIASKVETYDVKLSFSKLKIFKNEYYKIFKKYDLVYDEEDIIVESLINVFESYKLKDQIQLINNLRKRGALKEIIIVLEDYHKLLNNINFVYNFAFCLRYFQKDYFYSLEILEKCKYLLNKSKSLDTKIRYLNLLFIIYEEDVKDFFKAERVLNEISKFELNEELKIQFLINKAYLFYDFNRLDELKTVLKKLDSIDLSTKKEILEKNRCMSELYLKIDEKRSRHYFNEAVNYYNKEKLYNEKVIFLKYLIKIFVQTNDNYYLDILNNKIIYNKIIPIDELKDVAIQLLNVTINDKETRKILNKVIS